MVLEGAGKFLRLTGGLRETGGGGQRNNELLLGATASATGLAIRVGVGLVSHVGGVGLGEAG